MWKMRMNCTAKGEIWLVTQKHVQRGSLNYGGPFTNQAPPRLLEREEGLCHWRKRRVCVCLCNLKEATKVHIFILSQNDALMQFMKASITIGYNRGMSRTANTQRAKWEDPVPIFFLFSPQFWLKAAQLSHGFLTANFWSTQQSFSFCGCLRLHTKTSNVQSRLKRQLNTLGTVASAAWDLSVGRIQNNDDH